jgi:hypothetical protein
MICTLTLQYYSCILNVLGVDVSELAILILNVMGGGGGDWKGGGAEMAKVGMLATAIVLA